MSTGEVVFLVWAAGGMLLAWPISGLVVKEISPDQSAGDAFLVGFVTLLFMIMWPVLAVVWGFGRWAVALQRGLEDDEL